MNSFSAMEVQIASIVFVIFGISLFSLLLLFLTDTILIIVVAIIISNCSPLFFRFSCVNCTTTMWRRRDGEEKEEFATSSREMFSFPFFLQFESRKGILHSLAMGRQLFIDFPFASQLCNSRRRRRAKSRFSNSTLWQVIWRKWLLVGKCSWR